MNNIGAVKIEGVAPESFFFNKFLKGKWEQRFGQSFHRRLLWQNHNTQNVSQCILTVACQPNTHGPRSMRVALCIAFAKWPWFKPGPPKEAGEITLRAVPPNISQYVSAGPQMTPFAFSAPTQSLFSGGVVKTKHFPSQFSVNCLMSLCKISKI